jgi:hypothetical protein
MSEESDRMMVLLEELAVLKREGERNSRQSLVSKKRRKEISEEMKRLAAQKEEHSQ